MQRFTPWIKPCEFQITWPVFSVGIFKGFCFIHRDFVQGHMPLSQLTAITRAALGGSSNSFLTVIFAPGEGSHGTLFCFQSHFRHRSCDSIIPAIFPSVGHSPFFIGLAWKLLRPSSLGHFLRRTKWLLRDNEGLVMAICACGGHRKNPSQTSSKTNQE